MIDRDTILAQMEDLGRQRRAAEDTLCAVEGAMKLCRHWLARCEQHDREEAAEQAARNGRCPD